MDEVESLERATLAAVPPQQVVALNGWLAAVDDGTVGRAHSAAPTRHERIDAQCVQALLDCYAAHGRPAVFRIPQAGAFDQVRQQLSAAGFSPLQPTLTMTGDAGLPDAGPRARWEVRLADTPGEAFASVFLGEGFNPVDAASRLAILRRARHSVFACAVAEGQVVAVGSGCYAEGWCGFHAMRTLPAWRGRGLAWAILAALGREANRRGIARAFLQVEQANAGAQRLYRRAGLRAAWCYEYWRRR